jgi:hypothetical protein
MLWWQSEIGLLNSTKTHTTGLDICTLLNQEMKSFYLPIVGGNMNSSQPLLGYIVWQQSENGLLNLKTTHTTGLDICALLNQETQSFHFPFFGGEMNGCLPVLIYIAAVGNWTCKFENNTYHGLNICTLVDQETESFYLPFFGRNVNGRPLALVYIAAAVRKCP